MNPIPFLLIVVVTIGFEAMLFGEEIAQQSIIVPLPEIDSCDGLSGFDAMGCSMVAFLKNIGKGFAVFANVIAFLFNAATFNVPGAPPIVRAIVATLFSGTLAWVIVTQIRGTGS